MAEFMAVSSLDSTFFSDHEKQTRQSWRRSHSLSLSSKGGLPETDANILPDTSDLPESDLEKANSSEDPKPAFAGFDPSSFPDGGLQAWLVVSGAFCCLFCSFGWVNCVCSPIGASLIFYPAMSSTGTWFFKRRALAFGIMAAGSSLGGVILPIMVDRIIARAGFPWAMRGAAFLLLALLIYANLTVRSRLPPSPKPWSLMEFVLPFRELTFSLVVFASFLFFAGMFLPFTFVILSAQHDGMSERLAAYLVPILNAVSIFGRTIPGYIADKSGRFNTMIITCILSTLLVLCLWLPARGNIPYILFAAFYGFSSGAFVSLAPALVAQISDIRQIGVRTGSMFAVVSVAALMGNPIGGALVSSEDGGYWGLQVFCGVMMGAGSLVFVVSRWSLAGWGYVKV
ncbi:hypothetical protein XPA_003699 [Xanthoria parietina]